MVSLETVPPRSEDAAELRGLIEKHAERTGSDLAAKLLGEWDAALPRFVKVMPDDYKRVLEAQAQQAQAREAELNPIPNPNPNPINPNPQSLTLTLTRSARPRPSRRPPEPAALIWQGRGRGLLNLRARTPRPLQREANECRMKTESGCSGQRGNRATAAAAISWQQPESRQQPPRIQEVHVARAAARASFLHRQVRRVQCCTVVCRVCV